MKVIVGGTFGYLHKGHKALISRAFEVGDYVCIGLTTDAYVARMKPGEAVPGYSKRKDELEKFAAGFGKEFIIVGLNDKFGPSTAGDFDVVVVSRETLSRAEEINDMRTKNGLNALAIVVVDYVLAYDSKPISTTRICGGEIDREGNRLIGEQVDA